MSKKFSKTSSTYSIVKIHRSLFFHTFISLIQGIWPQVSAVDLQKKATICPRSIVQFLEFTLSIKMDTTSWTYSIQSMAAYQPEIVITHRDKQTRTVTDRDRQTNGQQQTKTVRQRKTDKTDRQTN